MASITVCGTCVPPGPSRKTTGWPLTVCLRDGNWERTQSNSSSFRVATVRSSVVMSNSFLGLLGFLSREYRVPEQDSCAGNERSANTLQSAVRRGKNSSEERFGMAGKTKKAAPPKEAKSAGRGGSKAPTSSGLVDEQLDRYRS